MVDIALRRQGDQLAHEASHDGEVVATGMLDPAPGVEVGSGGGSVEGTGAWPTDRDDGSPALYAWIGASLADYPEWVACDQPEDWCLLGGTDEHTLVRMDGLEEVGRVPDSAPDPVAALVELGEPAASARELLAGS